MNIVCIGGGPASLYFALLMKARDSRHRVRVFERNRLEDTFGFGVVFSDATMDNLREADADSYRDIASAFHHWDDIEIHYRGEILTSTGHGFAGLSRVRLLSILADRAAALGVELLFEREIGDLDSFADADLIVLGDGARSAFRARYADAFEPEVDPRRNRFVWLGTSRPFPAFTFYFRENEHGLWRVHAYQYDGGYSTFIVECSDETFAASGLSVEDESATVAYCEKLFAGELEGHPLLAKKSIWRRFPTIRNRQWHHGNRVLVGDAAHTAHFSVGSGTKLALEDAIALRDALDRESAAGDQRPLSRGRIERALGTYENERRGPVESLQRAAQASLQWFEDTERYLDLEPIQFGFSLLTRSLRITHHDLQLRDPGYVQSVDAWFADRAAAQTGVAREHMSAMPRQIAAARYSSAREYVDTPVPPPMFTPFRIRDLVLVNRVVMSAMCQYTAVDGVPNDWHFQHLASRALGGVGLIMTEMTDIAAEARITPACAGLYREDHVVAWKRIVDFVHANSWARIGIQLAHAGRKGSTRVSWEGSDEPLEAGGWPLVAASPLPWFEHSPVPAEMSAADMECVRDEFVAAALRAEAAGFDLIELHMAHGYLLSSFISPLTNRRHDEYGGKLADRMRFPLEVLDAVRAAWPAHKPISARISAVDWAPGGMQPEDSVAVARMLRDHDCDLVDVSAGQTVPYAAPAYGRQFQTPFADRIRHEVGIATMAVGNISSYMDVNTILAAGRADLCALARPHLWDPYWTRNAAYKQGYPLPWPDPYAVMDRFRPRFD